MHQTQDQVLKKLLEEWFDGNLFVSKHRKFQKIDLIEIFTTLPG